MQGALVDSSFSRVQKSSALTSFWMKGMTSIMAEMRNRATIMQNVAGVHRETAGQLLDVAAKGISAGVGGCFQGVRWAWYSQVSSCFLESAWMFIMASMFAGSVDCS